MSDLPARIDVAIIGAGFAGCAAAWALGRRGVRCIVLEREASLGRFASGRGAGLGRQLADDDATTALTLRGASVLRSELAAAWSPTGGILSFDDPDRAELYAARARSRGLDVKPIDREQILARWPAVSGLPLVAGLLVPTDGVIDIRALLALYAASARIVPRAGVSRVEAGGAGARITCARGSIEASFVVDASGAWAGSATGDPPLDALKRHLFVIEAQTSRRDGPYLWHLGSDELYARPDANGVLVSTCDATREPIGDATPDAAQDRVLDEVLARVAPTWSPAAIRTRWACHRAFTADRLMRLGRDPERPWLVWATGLGGHGATASAAVGEIVADACLGTRPTWSTLGPTGP